MSAEIRDNPKVEISSPINQSLFQSKDLNENAQINSIDNYRFSPLFGVKKLEKTEISSKAFENNNRIEKSMNSAVQEKAENLKNPEILEKSINVEERVSLNPQNPEEEAPKAKIEPPNNENPSKILQPPNSENLSKLAPHPNPLKSFYFFVNRGSGGQKSALLLDLGIEELLMDNLWDTSELKKQKKEMPHLE